MSPAPAVPAFQPLTVWQTTPSITPLLAADTLCLEPPPRQVSTLSSWRMRRRPERAICEVGETLGHGHVFPEGLKVLFASTVKLKAALRLHLRLRSLEAPLCGRKMSQSLLRLNANPERTIKLPQSRDVSTGPCRDSIRPSMIHRAHECVRLQVGTRDHIIHLSEQITMEESPLPSLAQGSRSSAAYDSSASS